MSTQAHPLPVRWSRWLLACAVRHWPEETRPWGEALAAEVHETSDGFESLLWSWGGIMLFARSVVGSIVTWLKLPAGSSLPGGASGPAGPSNLPRRSRLLTAVVLIAAAAMFLSPEGREAISTIRASWSNISQQSPSDRRALETLASRAEKENDATSLAFVAMTLDDPERATILADRAVSLNPELIWIYGAARLPAAARDDRLQRLQAADPGNALPLLLAAGSVAEESGAVFPEHLTPADVQAMLANNPKWMTLMTRALASPRYEGYDQRRSELTRSVWVREKNLSPTIVLRGTWLPGNPWGSLWNFSKIRAHEAEKAVAAGNWKEAERLLGEVDSFGQRIANNGNSIGEKGAGLWIAGEANIELGRLYTSAGQTAEAQGAWQRVQELKHRSDALSFSQRDLRIQRLNTFHTAGILVQSFSTLAMLAGFSAVLSILLLELWPVKLRDGKTFWQKVLCWTADYAPATALVASGALLLSFLPFARAFSEYRTSASALSGQEVIMYAFLGGWYWEEWYWRMQSPLWIWSFVTLALTALATFVVTRSFYRARVQPVTT